MFIEQGLQELRYRKSRGFRRSGTDRAGAWATGAAVQVEQELQELMYRYVEQGLQEHRFRKSSNTDRIETTCAHTAQVMIEQRIHELKYIIS